MRILCTMPGRTGDLLWALPTARALAEASGEPVDFCFSVGPGSGQTAESNMRGLLEAQAYIRKAWVHPVWETRPSGQVVPVWEPTGVQENVHQIDLHYIGWPQYPLAQTIAYIAYDQLPGGMQERWEVDLREPWITAPSVTLRHNLFHPPQLGLVIGFSDEWAELKAGLIGALVSALPTSTCTALLIPPCGSRLGSEWDWCWADREYLDDRPQAYTAVADLAEAAATIAGAKVYVGCLSALSVLAAALGKPRVLVEPNEARHNPIFQHWDTPLLQGGDGRPTVDARALVAAVKTKLEEGR